MPKSRENISYNIPSRESNKYFTKRKYDFSGLHYILQVNKQWAGSKIYHGWRMKNIHGYTFGLYRSSEGYGISGDKAKEFLAAVVSTKGGANINCFLE